MKVFISHSHADDALAYRIAEMLAGAGFDVWDERQILPGENWAAQAGAALEQSRAMVVLLTPHGVASKEVQSDVGFALGNKNFSGRVVPVVAGLNGNGANEDVPWILRRFSVIQLPDALALDEESLRPIANALEQAAPDLALAP